MPDLVVDLGGLTSLAGALERIRNEVRNAEAVLTGADDALGDDNVVDALHHFESEWSDGREKIENNADTLARMVRQSVQTFRETDQDLAGALRREDG